MCNNVLELASNPSTVFNVTELHSDPTYDVTDKFPDWMKREIKRQERINKILRWYQDLHWGWKLGVGIALLIGAIGFTVATGGGSAGRSKRSSNDDRSWNKLQLYARRAIRGSVAVRRVRI